VSMIFLIAWRRKQNRMATTQQTSVIDFTE
jgi:hypothetical protein